ncbi:MBL fold metallo-hydrolase [Dyella sp.]|jgi:glyoxylase-like metal-dependent hydrolase (beta-lactamase superfamily II)|uniref:MBL fold metallo-hydrolase n=1 Tax=Dyella sp. TaxID=1869338 RepID=UPI002D78871A|nr:MBL fold metallo-hydrolase [Dyella sp.]HET6433429.1 MBL fold metallo-hydrolase [Dyella sp.]
MRVHHLNCISTCPLGGRLMDGRTRSLLARGALVCHCLLIETDAGLVLVDTGFGLNDVHHPRDRLSGFFLALVKPAFREEMTAIRQIERLGFYASDVRHIVMSHLDFDHAGGLDDFPQARVHLLQRERDDAQAQRSWMDRQRFRPQQWRNRALWRTYGAERGEDWFGFERAQALDGLPDDILLVPLPGHTHGHCGIAVRAQGRWLLLAADAYFHEREMDPVAPCCTPGLRFYQWMLEKDRTARLANQARLRQLAANREARVRVFCSHDAAEFQRLAGRPAGVPVQALRR